MVTVVVLLGGSRLIAVVVDDLLDAPGLLLPSFLPSLARAAILEIDPKGMVRHHPYKLSAII